MPLSVREVLLVLRAKDQASRVIADVGRSFDRAGGAAEAAARRQIHAGQALLGVGVAMAAAGAAGIAFYANMTSAAVEYNRQAALTLTQVDSQAASLEQIKDIARRVGSEVGAPFAEMQSALYDIFSSTNATLPQAEVLLESFAKTAVAGQVSIQDAGRATIAILNAFKLPLEDVNKVQDVMFELVKKGVGDYEAFSTTIGRSIPSAARAGQTIEDLAGMLAFMTRNGLSAAMASASAARALDSFSNPIVVGRLEKMGIKVRDVSGNFRSISDVVTDLAAKTKNMKAPELASFLQNLFKGAGGTIQARRFWDTALRNPEALAAFTADMKNATGAATDAYNIMADTVAVKTQLLKNNWAILKTYIGDVVIPIFIRFVGIAQKVIKWFIDMDPKTRRLIVLISLAVSAFLVLAGTLVAVAGAMLIVGGALALLEIDLLPFLGVALLVVAALVALGIALYELYQNSETFRNLVDSIWQGLQRIADLFEAGGWRAVVDAMWTAIKDGFKAGVNTLWQDIQAGWDKFKADFGAGINTLWQDLQAGWDRILAEFPDKAMAFLVIIQNAVSAAWNWFTTTGFPTIMGWGATAADKFWNGFTGLAAKAANALLDLIASIGDWIGKHAQDLAELGLHMAEHIANGLVGGMLSVFKGIPLLGWAADDLKNWLHINVGSGGVDLSGKTATAVAGPTAPSAFSGFSSTPNPGEQAFQQAYANLATGTTSESTVNDIHDNSFFVADLMDFVNQLENQAKLNNKAAGAAQPSAKKGPTTKTLTPVKGAR
jgi:TP901 family phage tail tape measure protein